ncbi:MAG: N-formylglutamate amidohydrolase [Pseudomonadota bacterium]
MPGVFLRFDPLITPVPIVVEVSRSGREYPHEFRSKASFTDVHDNCSMYVEELWGATPELGGFLLYASFPNTFIDVNRGELDIDASLIEGDWPVSLKPSPFTERGLGLLKKVTRYGEPMHERKLTVAEVQDRMRRFYEPYHAELMAMIKQTRARFGRVWHLSCHCMSAVGASTHPDKGRPRADICLGNLDGLTSSDEFIQHTKAAFERAGYSVSLNDPYKGGELIRRHGSPDNGVESLLVEVNKKLFMDTKTFRKTKDFARVRRDFGVVLASLAQYAQKRCELVEAL